MRLKPKQYTRTFVARAVRLCDESKRPIAEVARDLGVEYVTLYSWMRNAGKTRRRRGPPAASAAPAASLKTMQAEIERLKRELEETKEKLEFAKKAAAFFAQQNQ